MQVLVLASSSTYRAKLLARLGLPFVQCAPNVNENPELHETPLSLVKRLAADKAAAIADRQWQDMGPIHNKTIVEKGSSEDELKPVIHADIVIASDQLAVLEGKTLGKPLTHDNACKQLRQVSGKAVSFLTSITLLNRRTKAQYTAVDTTTVQFRTISDSEIERYLLYDKPYDCAGSFKVESLGISLFHSVDSQDPTALEGLPLIHVCRGLRELGLELP